MGERPNQVSNCCKGRCSTERRYPDRIDCEAVESASKRASKLDRQASSKRNLRVSQEILSPLAWANHDRLCDHGSTQTPKDFAGVFPTSREGRQGGAPRRYEDGVAMV